jgi:hypothetical protein
MATGIVSIASDRAGLRASVTTKQASNSSTDQGSGKRRISGTKFPNFLLASHPLPKSIFWETTDRNFERKSLIFLARSDGFEPPTLRFEVWCSIQLSYERKLKARAQ